MGNAGSCAPTQCSTQIGDSLTFSGTGAVVTPSGVQLHNNTAATSVTLDFRDYADTDDDDMAHAVITSNCTTTTTGAEDCDFTIAVVEGGAAPNIRFNIDADANLVVGSNQQDAVVLITNSGTVNVDGYVQARKLVVSLASGAMTMNAITLGTGDGTTDFDIPNTACDAAGDVGNWFTLVVEDASTVHSIQPLDTSNILIVEGLAQSAGEELDSCASGTENEGCSITMTCLAADQWYSTARVGTWAVGGAAD